MTFVIARVIAVTVLFLALGKHPYWFYTILRFVVCGVAAYGAFFAIKLERKSWAWSLGIVAILFNPFIPIHLDRDTWAIIDVIVALVIIVSLFLLRKPTVSRKDISDNTILLVLFLLYGLILGAFIMFSNYVGIPLGDIENDDNMNIIGYCLGFISLLFAWRVLYLIFFRKTDGDWTSAGKARWRYCVVGALATTLFCTPIEYLNISEFLRKLLEIAISIGIAVYFYIKYLNNYKYKTKTYGVSTDENNEGDLRNKP